MGSESPVYKSRREKTVANMERHYWLFEGEEGKAPFPVEDTDPKVFTSLDDARAAAFALGIEPSSPA
jgi:hypothetical protein